MPSDAGPDTVECVNCGSDIRKHASICHNCGVSNEHKPGKTKSISSADATNGGDSSLLSIEGVSSQWQYGIVCAICLWIVALALSSIGFEGGEVGLLVLVSWIGQPIATFFDIHYVRENSDWQPNTVLWVVGSAVWFVNIVVGGVYLLRRRENL